MIWLAIAAILIAAFVDASASNLKRIEKRSASEENAAIEIFNYCKCVKYSQCKDDNSVTSGKEILTKKYGNGGKVVFYATPIKCQTEGLEEELVCCKLENIGQQSIDRKINIGNVEKFPWMAAVYNRTTAGNFVFKCGGSLIHQKVVLTASHCLDNQSPGDLVVVVNGKERLSIKDTNEEEKRYVSKIIRHPRYDVDALFNDAALLILKEKFKIKGRNIKLLKLPPEHINLALSKCFVAGWGETADGETLDTMKKLEVPFVEHSECQSRLRTTALGRFFNLDDSFLCAGGEQGKDACTGDGGGPLMCKAAGTKQYYQAGIVAWGMGCGDENVPGVYVDVPKISEWIQNEIVNNT